MEYICYVWTCRENKKQYVGIPLSTLYYRVKSPKFPQIYEVGIEE